MPLFQIYNYTCSIKTACELRICIFKILINISRHVFKRWVRQCVLQRYTVIIPVVLYCFKKKKTTQKICLINYLIMLPWQWYTMFWQTACWWLTMKEELDVPGRMNIHRDILPLSEWIIVLLFYWKKIVG